MSTRIKDATPIDAFTDTIMLPVGNTSDQTAASAGTVLRLKEYILSDISEVGMSGAYSDLTGTPDLSGYATMSTLNTNFYNRSQVNSLIGSITGPAFKIVDELPEEGVNGVIFLIEQGGGENVYDEYVWLEDGRTFELIGSTETDLSDYYTKAQTEALIPTVNNSTITLKQGGTTKGVITLNQSTGTTINFDAPEPQVQADWTEDDTTKPTYIQNKPSIPTVYNPTVTFTQGGVSKGSITLNQSTTATIELDATTQLQSDWNEADNSMPDYIKNKPAIPTVNNSTITFTQGGVTKGSITLNQSTNQTIALDSGSGAGTQSDWTEDDPTEMSYIQNKPGTRTLDIIYQDGSTETIDIYTE